MGYRPPPPPALPHVPFTWVDVTTFGDEGRVYLDPVSGKLYQVPLEEERDADGRVVRLALYPYPYAEDVAEEVVPASPAYPFDAPQAPKPPKGFDT